MDFKDSQLFRVYLMLFFKNVAGSMFHLFTPVFLFVNGFSFLQIGLFFIFSSVVTIISLLVLSQGVFKIRTKLAINIGLMFLVLAMISLYFIPTNPEIIFITPILFGLSTTFFWTSVQTTFAYESKGKMMGKEAGIYVIMQKSGNILGPLIASLIIIFSGFEFIYMAAIVFILLTMVTATTLKASFKIHKINLTKAFSRFDRGMSIALGADGANGRILTFAVPLFIFIILGSAASVGWVMSGAVLLGFISIFIVSYVTDYKKKFEKRLFKIGVTMSSITWILRIFAFNFWSLLILEYFDNLSSSSRTVPFVAYYYNKARNSHHVLEYTIVREIIMHTAMILVVIPVALLMTYVSIQAAFVVGAIVVLFEIFMVKKPYKLFYHRHMHPHK